MYNFVLLNLWTITLLGRTIAPATLVQISHNTDHPVYNQTESGDFTLICLVSATNLTDINFKHNGTKITNDMHDEYFDISTNDRASCENGCKYGLNTAHEIQVKWKALDLNFTSCGDVVYYDGEYECEATARTAGDTKTETSKKINIATYYSAIWANPDPNSRLIAAENEEANVSLTCDVCAMHRPSFTWYFNGTDNSSKISDDHEETYTIAFVNRSYFGRYFCQATNEVAAPFFYIDLKQSGRPGNPHSFNIMDNVTSTSVTVEWTEGHSGNNPPVIFILDVGPTVYEYCNTSNFEKYTEVDGSKTGIVQRQHQVLIEGLHESTQYCIRIKAENQRVGYTNASDYVCNCGSQTKASPVIANIKITRVERDKLTIEWKYDKTQQYDTHKVGLKFEYQAENENSSTTYPRYRTIDANAEIVEIRRKFDTDQALYAIATIYEGNNTMPSYKLEMVSIPGESGATALIVVGTLLTVTLLVLVSLGAVIYRFKPEWVPHRFSRLKGYQEGNRPPGEYDTTGGTGQNEDEGKEIEGNENLAYSTVSDIEDTKPDEGNEIEGNENLAYSTVSDIEDTKPDKECKVPHGKPATVYADIDMVQTKLHEGVPREVKQPDTTPEDLSSTYAEGDFPEPKDREPPKNENVKVPEQLRGKPKTLKNKAVREADGDFPLVTTVSTRKQAFDAGNTLDELKVVHSDTDLTSRVSIRQTSDSHTTTVSIAIVQANPTIELTDPDYNEEEI